MVLPNWSPELGWPPKQCRIQVTVILLHQGKCHSSLCNSICVCTYMTCTCTCISVTNPGIDSWTEFFFHSPLYSFSLCLLNIQVHIYHFDYSYIHIYTCTSRSTVLLCSLSRRLCMWYSSLGVCTNWILENGGGGWLCKGVVHWHFSHKSITNQSFSWLLLPGLTYTCTCIYMCMYMYLCSSKSHTCNSTLYITFTRMLQNWTLDRGLDFGLDYGPSSALCGQSLSGSS